MSMQTKPFDLLQAMSHQCSSQLFLAYVLVLSFVIC